MTAAPLLPAALLALAAFAPARQGLAVPRNDGWVTDLAGLLAPEQERSLESLMESYRAGSGHEIALLTVPELKGEPIERFALNVAREWKMGREGAHDAALLVASKEDRALRIEVGRGLEGSLTDSISGRIIRDVIVPRFKAGAFYEGLREGIEAIHAAAGGDYGPLRERGSDPRPARWLGALPPVLFLLFLLLALAHRGRRGRRAFPLGGPVIFPGTPGGRLRGGWGGGGFGGGGISLGGGFGGFGGGGGFSGGGASGRW